MGLAKEVEISCEIRRETEKAFLVYDGKREVWVPKSQITDYGETSPGVVYSIFLPEWLAIEKELV